ncbi:hypothetical protein ACFUJY_11190 [Streptomyces sp. NPDC057249]|uniref:hypothetical protein n=1 Tax=Streptomyces sp. NPDC057249 TaxID=3346067 RepID=UPI00363B70AB
MLWHAISPSRAYVKATHDVVRHPNLSSDAKLLIMYVQGLPESRASEALSDHAKRLGIKGRAYQKAKGQLKAAGYVHEWRWQGQGGLWMTDQLFSNVPLTDEEARALRVANAQAKPTDRPRAGGQAGTRSVGASQPEVVEEREKNTPHPPTEAPAAEAPVAEAAGPVTATDAEVAQAERVLLSLRHANPQLHLGVREARGLSGMAADWLRRGVKAADLRQALVNALPAEGVRSAYGFVRHRLVHKLPEVPAPIAPVATVRPHVTCEGDGPEHVFRPRADETLCGPCGRQAAEEAHFAKWPPRRQPWRERVATILETDAAAY